MQGGLKLENKIKVLMIGPARNVKGGMTTVVDNYFEYGLQNFVNLKYIESCNDTNIFSKFLKEKKGLTEFKRIMNNYDIMHIHMASRRSTFRKGKYVKLAKKIGKKVILHIHGAEFKLFYNECTEKQKKYVREILNLADKIIVLSEGWKKYFKTMVDENKIIVIYNSIIVPKDFKKNLETQSILFLGRIGYRKGIYDLIEVVNKLLIEFPKLKLYIGGDGEVNKLKNLIEEKKMQDNIKYIGWVSGKEKEKMLKECSFYILPSYNEGLPMSILEGMAYKNITISTNVGGIPEVIKNNYNGFIFTPGNTDELYNLLKKVLKDKEKRIRLSCNARKTIEEKFNIVNNINTLLTIYRNIYNNGVRNEKN